MRKALLLLLTAIASFSFYPNCTGQDSKTKESKSTGVFTQLGTIKGEIDKVIEGGRRLEVKYKELVTTASSSSSSSKTKGGVAGKFRPPAPKEFTQKEKNQEIEVRVLDDAVIRILNTSDAAAPSKSSDSKKRILKTSGKTNSEDEQGNGKDKSPTKPSKQSVEPPLPGKAGDPGSLKKGQIILITVYREDLPGFSRLVTNTIYILGEK